MAANKNMKKPIFNIQVGIPISGYGIIRTYGEGKHFVKLHCNALFDKHESQFNPSYQLFSPLFLYLLHVCVLILGTYLVMPMDHRIRLVLGVLFLM